jgi:hypothetical protein
MSSYSTVRNTGFASILVASLAGVVSNGVALNQQVVFERELPEQASVVVLPEVLVTASRLEW